MAISNRILIIRSLMLETCYNAFFIESLSRTNKYGHNYSNESSISQHCIHHPKTSNSSSYM
ncbi:hypothetical protein YC2023_004950 [Brassica napus]